MVEGYTDVISLWQHGVKNVVASSGTALTEDQVKTLDRYAKRVLLLYDADEAGGRAAVRGVDLVLEQGMGAYVVELPEGDDPDSFVRSESGEAFEEYIDDHRLDLPSYKHRRARRSGQIETPEDRVEMQRDIIASVARIPDPNLRREYVRRTSEVVDVPDSDLFRMLEEEREKLQKERERRARRKKKRREIQKRSKQPASAAPGASGGSTSSSAGSSPQAPHPAERVTADDEARADAEGEAPPPEERVQNEPMPEEKVLLRLMLEQGEPMVEFILGNMALDEFTDGTPREAVTAFIEMYQEEDVNPQRILDGRYGDDVQRLAASVMVDEHQLSDNWARNKNIAVPRLNNQPYEAAESAMTLLKLDRVNETIQAHKQRMRRANDAGDTETMTRLQQKMMSLYKLRKRIENREFINRDEAVEAVEVVVEVAVVADAGGVFESAVLDPRVLQRPPPRATPAATRNAFRTPSCQRRTALTPPSRLL